MVVGDTGAGATNGLIWVHIAPNSSAVHLPGAVMAFICRQACNCELHRAMGSCVFQNGGLGVGGVRSRETGGTEGGRRNGAVPKDRKEIEK